MTTDKVFIPTIAVTATEELRLVQTPSSLTNEEKMACLSSLISSMTKQLPTHRQTVEVVYNLFYIGLEGLSTAFEKTSSIKVVSLTPSKDHFLAWLGLAEKDDKYREVGFPLLPNMPQEEAAGVTDPTAVYAGMATILFCIGRQASESARAAVMDNRPDALIRKYDIQEANQVLLPGRSCGPSREMLEQVYNAFSNYPEIRYQVISYFLGLKRSVPHLPLHLDIMMTNFHLMRGAGMTHVEAIIRLAQMHPWTLRVPPLRPYYEKFLADLEKFGTIPADTRPYHRLLVSQDKYLFISSELRPLIAVAGSFIEEVEKTFGGYVYNRAAYQQLIDEVHSRAPNYNPTSGLSRLAQLIGVPEEPLPPKKGVPMTPESSTV